MCFYSYRLSLAADDRKGAIHSSAQFYEVRGSTEPLRQLKTAGTCYCFTCIANVKDIFDIFVHKFC